MAFEGLREKLKDQWGDLSSKIQENPTFNNLREKFESQSPTVQRAIIAGVAFFAVMFLISFPWGYISSSQDHMTDFEANRGLIQGLLHASRSAKEPSPLPPPVPSEMLKARVDSIIRENRLIPDQVGEIAPMPGSPAKELAPKIVIQTGLVVVLKKLNLEQVIALSHQFQTMGPGTKLMGLDMVQSAGQTHYYDMNARIVNFALPIAQIEEPPPEKTKPGKRAPPKRKSQEEEPSE